ncbi:MAG: AAA family ATPase [Lachnospiraceae bacterium]|nr:AAA family ATPase [Lachnospiraceae bacterium]
MSAQESNPFSITFGKEPREEINRDNILEEIIEDFTAETPSQQAVLLTGVRGSGKSSLTAKLMKTLGKRTDWLVTDLIVEGDMLNSLGGKLCELPGCRKLFNEAEISLSVFGAGIKISKTENEANIEAVLDKMLRTLSHRKKRVLITIDDVASTKEMRIFSHFFQSCIMKDYSLYLIMNGVYDNIDGLQNEKTLTFLQRAPKISLTPLNKTAVANMYARIFDYSDATIRKMATLTEGYPYAVQALGYTVWKYCRSEKEVDFDSVIPRLDLLLADGVYDKLWIDMSETDRQICFLIAEGDAGGSSIASVIEKAGISKSLASNYKKRLVKKGIVEDVRGRFMFSLPRFDWYVREQLEI